MTRQLPAAFIATLTPTPGVFVWVTDTVFAGRCEAISVVHFPDELQTAGAPEWALSATSRDRYELTTPPDPRWQVTISHIQGLAHRADQPHWAMSVWVKGAYSLNRKWMIRFRAACSGNDFRLAATAVLADLGMSAINERLFPADAT